MQPESTISCCCDKVNWTQGGCCTAKDLFSCFIRQVINVSLFIQWNKYFHLKKDKMVHSMSFHRLPRANICTIVLINIHYLCNVEYIATLITGRLCLKLSAQSHDMGECIKIPKYTPSGRQLLLLSFITYPNHHWTAIKLKCSIPRYGRV